MKEQQNEHGLQGQLGKISSEAQRGDLRASFLIEQIQAFGKKKCKFQETTLKLCVLLSRRSPGGYRFLRDMKILHLPHQKTLKSYVGFSKGETGITSLIKERLIAEEKSLNQENEKVGSIIIDEMAIKAKLQYDRNLDMFLGMSDIEKDAVGIEDKLANKLLCFLFKGLSTFYRIPVSFYFTSTLNGEQLAKLTLNAVKAVEECGFKVVRIVTDNCQINVSMFQTLCEGKISHEIKHPFDANRPLFFSFDPAHILKNVRSQHLARNFELNGNSVTGDHIRKLYNIQKGLVMKPVRKLTRKVVYPTNLEKMNVARAKVVFSPEVIAGLKSMEVVCPELLENNDSLRETVNFVEMFRKWFDIHDICNSTHGIHSRNDNKLMFAECYDERLNWLLSEFLPYIENIQSNKDKLRRFTRETYEALVITTRSTVACIKYLISINFHYVLTRNFTSDDIELFFSHIRRMGGHNDMMDVRSCIYAMESTLQTGVIAASKHGNVELRDGVADAKSAFTRLLKSGNSQEGMATQNSSQSGQTCLQDLPEDVLNILNEPIEGT